MKLNISLRQRIAFGFFLIVVVVFLTVAVGVWSTFSLQGVINTLNANVNQIEAIAEMEESWQDVASTVDNMLLFKQSAALVRPRLDRQVELFQTQLTTLNTMTLGQRVDMTAENQQIAAELQQKGQELVDSIHTIEELTIQGRWASAQIYRQNQMSTEQYQFDRIVDRLRANIRAEVEFSVEQTRGQQNTTQILWAIAAIFAVGVAITSAVLVDRSITRPVYQLIEQVERVTHRNFSPITPLPQQDEIGALSRAVALMTDWLRESYSTLEDQVSARTERLELVARLSGQLSAILNLEDLLDEVVNQVRDSFGYYHAHIYLLNETENRLVVAAGTGSAGAKMKADGHNIPVNTPTSLVARAARTGQNVYVGDVYQAPDWLPNALLPDTVSEMAVPIMPSSTGKVVGVLDVQQNKAYGFDESDTSLLQSLANHVAIAINNARLFEQVEAALNEAHQVQARYIQQTWDRTRLKPQTADYHYTRIDASPLHQAEMEQIKALASTQAGPHLITLNENEKETLPTHTDLPIGEQEIHQAMVAPVALHNQQIGTVQIHTAGSNSEWTEDDLTILAAVVDELAQTAENLRLFDKTRQRAGREQTTRQIIEKMRASPDIESIINTGLKELSAALDTDRIYVRLSAGTNSDNQALNFGSESLPESLASLVGNGNRKNHNDENGSPGDSISASKRK